MFDTKGSKIVFRRFIPSRTAFCLVDSEESAHGRESARTYDHTGIAKFTAARRDRIPELWGSSGLTGLRSFASRD